MQNRVIRVRVSLGLNWIDDVSGKGSARKVIDSSAIARVDVELLKSNGLACTACAGCTAANIKARRPTPIVQTSRRRGTNLCFLIRSTLSSSKDNA